MTPEQRIAAYQDAFTTANGRKPRVEYDHGWYRIFTSPEYYSTAHRAWEIDRMISVLLSRQPVVKDHP